MRNMNLYLSSTNIQVFLSCKRKYKYKYIDKINTKAKVSSKYLSFGNSIHLTLAQFNMITDKKYRTIDNLHMLLRKNWKREGYASREEEREYGLNALDMLSNYFNNPHDQGQKNMIIEEMIRKNMDGKCTLAGKLDKVYLREDGLIEVLDYKTGKNIEPFNAMQMPIYILLAQEKLGCYPNIISNYYMSHNKKIEEEVTEQVIEEAINNIWHIYSNISLEEEFLPSPTNSCKTMCEYYEICDAAKDSNLIMLNTIMNLNDKENIETVF